jgi:hypothetical protein
MTQSLYAHTNKGKRKKSKAKKKTSECWWSQFFSQKYRLAEWIKKQTYKNTGLNRKNGDKRYSMQIEPENTPE